jgi:hypothetical protein
LTPGELVFPEFVKVLQQNGTFLRVRIKSTF